MRMYIGVTDERWYEFLERLRPDEVNFWQPGGRAGFKALNPGELFLFKLHSPKNFIVGGGVFLRHAFLPVSLAWQAFAEKNGTPNYYSFRESILRYRKVDPRTEPDPTIGCIVLSQPFFFSRDQWIPVPSDWSSNIVQGKTYDDDSLIGRDLRDQVLQRVSHITGVPTTGAGQHALGREGRYGKEYLVAPRVGQGGFRLLVTEAYHRRCAITGEKTLPVLDAAHIRPYSLEGPHDVANGLLLRQDVHTLFDRGYITVNEEFRIEVSRRIKEDYGNGREYYAMHGKPLEILPDRDAERPSKDYLLWHNENVYLA